MLCRAIGKREGARPLRMGAVSYCFRLLNGLEIEICPDILSADGKGRPCTFAN